MTPEPGQGVSVELDGLGSHHARVDSVDGDEVRLVLLAREPLAPGPPLTATLEYTYERGVCRWAGTVERLGLAGLRFAAAAAAAEPERDQRREFVRVDLSRPAIVALGGPRGPRLATWTVEVSAAGVLLAGSGAGPDEVLWLSLRLGEGEEPIEVLGRLVRVTDEGHHAVRFDTIAAADRERLVRHLSEVQRRALRVRGGS